MTAMIMMAVMMTMMWKMATNEHDSNKAKDYEPNEDHSDENDDCSNREDDDK